MRSSTAQPKRDERTGTWYFVFDSARPRADGTRRQIYRRGFTTLAQAKRELDTARRVDNELMEDVDGDLTVRAVFADFIRTKRLAGRAPNTLAQYEWAAKIADARWGGWPPDKLTRQELDTAYLAMLAGGRRQFRRGAGTKIVDRPLSPRSVVAFHVALKAAFQLAVDRGTLVRNPAAMATPPASPDVRAKHWWTPDQVGAFLAILSAEPCLTAALGEMLIDTGGRRGEVLGLRWEDLDLTAGTATIVQQLVEDPGTKQLTLRRTKRPRSKSVIGLHPETVAALRRRRAEQSADQLASGHSWPGPETLHHGLVFTWPTGKAIHPNVVTRTVARMSVAAGLPRLTPHGLRHSFATAALSARVPVEVVAARLGNSARVVQQTYSHVIPADDEATALLVGDLYRAAGHKQAADAL